MRMSSRSDTLHLNSASLGSAEESSGLVVVEAAVGFGDFCGLDGVEAAELGATGKGVAVGVAQVAVPGYGVVGDVVEVLEELFHLCLEGGDALVGGGHVEAQDALHAYLPQSQQVVVSDVAQQLGQPWVEEQAQAVEHALHLEGLLHVRVLVHALGDEDALQ